MRASNAFSNFSRTVSSNKQEQQKHATIEWTIAEYFSIQDSNSKQAHALFLSSTQTYQFTLTDASFYFVCEHFCILICYTCASQSFPSSIPLCSCVPVWFFHFIRAYARLQRSRKRLSAVVNKKHSLCVAHFSSFQEIRVLVNFFRVRMKIDPIEMVFSKVCKWNSTSMSRTHKLKSAMTAFYGKFWPEKNPDKNQQSWPL